MSAQEFIESLANPELNRLVALFMGAEPYHEGYCVVWPDYAGSWEMTMNAFEVLAFEHEGCLADNGCAIRDGRRFTTFGGHGLGHCIARAAAYLVVQEVPDGYVLDVETEVGYPYGRHWLEACLDHDGSLQIGKHNSIADAKMACWRHYLDGEMARGVVEVYHE